MKRRLLSFVMCLALVLSTVVMASCSDEDNSLAISGGENDGFTTTSKNDPITICIYSIRGEGTTDEAIELVEKELSRIAVARYNTTIDLILIDEEDYAAMVFTKLRMAISAYNTSRLDPSGLTQTKEEMDEIKASNVDYQDENGRSYGVREATNLSSEVLNGTFDIFLCYTPEEGNKALYNPDAIIDENPLGMFEILYREKALAPLTTYLNGLYSDVKNILYTHALDYVTRPSYKNASAKEVYGIPNNYVYGSYDYIIFNEDYVNEFISPNGNGVDKSEFIPIGGQNTSRYRALILELANKHVLDKNISFKTYDEYEAYVNENASGEKLFDIDLETRFESYEDYLDYTIDDGDFAIARISGSMAVKELFSDEEKHDNLDVYVEKANSVTNQKDFCDSMYCIGINNLGKEGDAVRVQRSMDVLKLINTNKEFRNILQYGVEGTHYTQYTEDEDVNPLTSSRKDSKYMNVNPKYFGNMFLLYSSTNMTEAEKLLAKDNWQMAKDQIIDLVPWITEDREGE